MAESVWIVCVRLPLAGTDGVTLALRLYGGPAWDGWLVLRTLHQAWQQPLRCLAGVVGDVMMGCN